MPSENSQSFASHARYFPLFHFVASPITLIYFVYATVQAVKSPDSAHIIAAIWAFGIAAGVFSSRVMAITVQNRVIRLEMRLRLKEILPPALAARIRELTVRQLIALRFAGDAEMPSLVERVLKGEFATPKEVKRAVRDWQPDHLRA